MIQKVLKKKNFQHNSLLNLLFKSKSYVGESFKDTNNNILPFVYGTRHKYSIIDLRKVSFFLKRSLKLMEYFVQKKKKILIIGNSKDMKFLLNKSFIKNNKNIFFYDKKWMNGLISNPHTNSILYKKKIDLIFVIKTALNEEFLDRELSKIKIPVLAFVNTKQDIKNINYPIVTNLNNIKSIFSLMFLFRKVF